jgi:hypothetical protein
VVIKTTDCEKLRITAMLSIVTDGKIYPRKDCPVILYSNTIKNIRKLKNCRPSRLKPQLPSPKLTVGCRKRTKA